MSCAKALPCSKHPSKATKPPLQMQSPALGGAFLWAKKTPPERGLFRLQVVEVITQPSKGAVSLNHPQQSAKALP